MSSKVYRRTEDGSTTYLSQAEGDAEINRLRAAYARGEIRELFAGARGATYTNADGLRIHLHLEDAPERTPERVYERTENGVTTFVSLKDGGAEVDRAQMGPRRDIREMSSSRGQHAITYRDGRKVTLVMVDRPEAVPTGTVEAERPSTSFRIVTAKGKRYMVSKVIPARPRTPGATSWIPYASVSYWSERNGERFGATRSAAENSKPGTVGALIWAQVAR
jgi:hypothetical protein